MVPYGPIYGPRWALMGPPGQVLAGPISDFWSNFARFGSKNGILTKFVNDSASFLPEKLKNHVILTKKIKYLTKDPENTSKNKQK